MHNFLHRSRGHIYQDVQYSVLSGGEELQAIGVPITWKADGEM